MDLLIITTGHKAVSSEKNLEERFTGDTSADPTIFVVVENASQMSVGCTTSQLFHGPRSYVRMGAAVP